MSEQIGEQKKRPHIEQVKGMLNILGTASLSNTVHGPLWSANISRSDSSGGQDRPNCASTATVVLHNEFLDGDLVAVRQFSDEEACPSGSGIALIVVCLDDWSLMNLGAVFILMEACVVRMNSVSHVSRDKEAATETLLQQIAEISFVQASQDSVEHMLHVVAICTMAGCRADLFMIEQGSNTNVVLSLQRSLRRLGNQSFNRTE